MTDADKEEFIARISDYLTLIGGPDGPKDSPINPVSHFRLLKLQQKFGKAFVDKYLDDFFRDHPTW